jgi:3-hydroxyisobutyrate dehydrogenase
LARRLGYQELNKQTAFLGLGIMGSSMAANLARAGFNMRGWNRTPGRESAKRAAEAGVQLVGSASEAVAEATIVFLCLSDVNDIRDVLLGAAGIAGEIPKGAIVVDMSTTGPACARELAAALTERGVRFLDAPVSGGDVGAREGTLTIMVGGDQQAFDECMPWLQAMGKNIRYCGGSGSGQAVKLCNQVLCAVNMIAVCEAFELAQEQGIDPKLVVEVCQTGAAGSWALANLGPRIFREELGPGFKIKDMLKDLRLVGEQIQGDGELPGVDLSVEKFIAASKLGGTNGGDQGTHAMIRAYRKK